MNTEETKKETVEQFTVIEKLSKFCDQLDLVDSQLPEIIENLDKIKESLDKTNKMLDTIRTK